MDAGNAGHLLLRLAEEWVPLTTAPVIPCRRVALHGVRGGHEMRSADAVHREEPPDAGEDGGGLPLLRRPRANPVVGWTGMRYCEHCGKPLVPAGRFCEHCGAPVAMTPPVAPPPVVPTAQTPVVPPTPPPTGHARPRRRMALAIALVVCLVAAATGGFLFLTREDGPVSVTLPGGFEVRGPGEAFPGDDPELALTEREDGFLDAFGLDSERRVLSVTADEQPEGPVEIVVPYDPETVAEGAVPAVFYFDEDADLWLPIETEADPEGGRLIGTAEHFTDFAAGLLDGFLDVAETVVNTAATGVDWLAYQVASATGARAQEPACGAPAPWVTGIRTTYDPGFRLSAALFACAEAVAGNPDRVRLRIAVNRAYGFALTSDPPAASIAVEPTAQLTGALGATFSKQFRAENGTVIAPGTATVLMEFDRPADDVQQLAVEGHMTAESTLIDALMLALEVGSIFAEGDPTEKVEAFECAVALIKGAGDISSKSVFLGTWSKVVDDCLGPAARGAGDAVLRRFAMGISVGLSMGQVGQSFLDRERDLLDGVHLLVGVAAPGSFAGRWEGPVPQPGVPGYSTVVNVTDSAGRLSANVSYPELECSGIWTQVTRAQATAELDETITVGAGPRCVASSDINLTLLSDGRLRVTYAATLYPPFDAVLTRTGASGPSSTGGGGPVADPPAGAVYLSDVLTASGGPGSSGDRIDAGATISGRSAAHATSQWVGCSGDAAWAEYDLSGQTRLTGWLGYRDFAEPGLTTQVSVYVDDMIVSMLEVDLSGIEVDLDLPPGQRLRLEATLVGGDCGMHSEGYLAWGNGALS